MAKSLRSKRKQKIKRVRREKYRKVERKKCWEKHLAIQADKNEMVLGDAGAVVSASIAADPAEKPVDPDVSMEDSTVATTEGDDKPQISRKQVLKKMKLREARKKRRKTKRLGGKHSHSKW